MGTKNIFLDEESEEILKKLKENVNFNFSQYIQNHLKSHSEDKLTPELVTEKISETKRAILSQEEYLGKLNMTMDKINRQRKIIEERNIGEIEHQSNMISIQDYLKDLKDNKEKWAEYQKGKSEGKWKGVVEFAKIKLGLEND